MTRLEVDLCIETQKWREHSPHVTFTVCRAMEEAWKFTSLDVDCEVSILLSDKERVSHLNNLYRGKNKTTNVLSFPMREEFSPGGPVHLGDVVLSCETVVTEAQQYKRD